MCSEISKGSTNLIKYSTILIKGKGDSFDQNDDSGLDDKISLKLRSSPGAVSQSSGFQAATVIFCLEGDDEPANVVSLKINTNWGICIAGTTNGIIVIDYIQNKKILAMSTLDLLRYFYIRMSKRNFYFSARLIQKVKRNRAFMISLKPLIMLLRPKKHLKKKVSKTHP